MRSYVAGYKRPYKEEFWKEMILVPTLERFKVEFLAKKEEERRLHKLLERCKTGIFCLTALEKVCDDDYRLIEVQRMLDKARKETDEI